jgi:hypothetical protein
VGRPSHRWEGNIKKNILKKGNVNCPPVQNLLSAVSNGEICEHVHRETSRGKKVIWVDLVIDGKIILKLF